MTPDTGHDGIFDVSDLRTFDIADDLAAALAAYVAEGIEADLAARGAASLAVSGGRTPGRFFAALAARDLDWSRVVVTLVDERWVPETSPRSNAALVRAGLLTGRAAAARFVPLHGGEPTPEEGMDALAARLADLPLPFSAVVLGMGDDGHTASFFPGGDRLAEAIDADTDDLVSPMRAPGAGEPRITFTLPAILGARRLALHIEGEGKRDVLARALSDDDATEMPVRAVLGRAPAMPVFWCP